MKGLIIQIGCKIKPGDRVEAVSKKNTLYILLQHIVNELSSLDDWVITYDTFYDTPPPPYNQKTKFKSIIATYNPDAGRRLILACHHDSKVKEIYKHISY